MSSFPVVPRCLLPGLMLAAFMISLVLSMGVADATSKPGERGSKDGMLQVPVEDEELSQRDWLWLPIPSNSPATGFGLAALGAYLYRLDEESQTSMSGFGAYGSTNGSWAVGALQRANFGHGRWRLDLGMGYASVNYTYFGQGNDAGDNGLGLPITQKGWVIRPRAYRRIFENFYAGLQYRYLTSQTTIRFERAGQLPAIPERPELPGLQVDVDAGLLGLLLKYDSRNSEWTPTSGLLFDVQFDLGRKNLGNDFDYETLRLTFSHYIELKPNHVIAYNAHLCAASNDTPFFDICLYGSSNTLRGYEAGQYRDNAMVAIQAEYRWKFTKKFGLAVFAGVGAVASDIGDLGKEGWLPSAGVGLRYLVSEVFGVNIGADYAWGKNSEAFYIRIGEAF
jgi:outer membrane protein assembly factor BamA